MRAIPHEVVQVLRSAGWNEGGVSKEQVAEWATRLEGLGYTVGPAALDALQAYGGVHVEVGGLGDDTRRESFDFRQTHAAREFDRFSDFARDLGMGIVPLGEAARGNWFVGIAEDGRVFGVATEMWFYGRSIDEAVVNMILGRSVPPEAP
ncbi:MAG TPA: SUKH-3 domain-containing protein [Candidatus Dormibacteraeota bacterium]